MTTEELKSIFETYLRSFLSSLPEGRGTFWQAYRYAMEGTGKRVRPLLVLLSNQACGGHVEAALPAALALEMIHTYSLIHDDLPCMDNDNWRRGRPTLHRAFDEGTALLVGDALLTDAFHVLTAGIKEFSQVPPVEFLVPMVQELSRCAGSAGMVWGQALDTYWTGRTGYSQQDLDDVHLHKTGQLIAGAMALGGLSARASAPTLQELRSCGMKVGLAFQIIDDLLDEKVGTGKSVGKDRDQGKLTYLIPMNATTARLRANELTADALRSLQGPHTAVKPLQDFISKLLDRQL